MLINANFYYVISKTYLIRFNCWDLKSLLQNCNLNAYSLHVVIHGNNEVTADQFSVNLEKHDFANI